MSEEDISELDRLQLWWCARLQEADHMRSEISEQLRAAWPRVREILAAGVSWQEISEQLREERILKEGVSSLWYGQDVHFLVRVHFPPDAPQPIGSAEIMYRQAAATDAWDDAYQIALRAILGR